MDPSIIASLLPPSLNLPPHLSAHKYFFVCTLTVAAWDTLVLSPRAWRLMKTKEWPVLKIVFQVLRFLMPIEFIIVAVAFFDTKFTRSQCDRFYLFEPICTMVLLSLASAVHVIRVHAIYEKSRAVLGGLGVLLLIQVATMAVCCAFYRVMPLDVGQGCIAGPIDNWVGIYWAAPTLFYTVTFALALNRSVQSLKLKPLSPWKLMLRDGLNLYAAIWIVNMVNVLFWFIVRPTGENDTIKTTVTSMTAVLTTTMTLRIILSVRGSLAQGGSYAGSSIASSQRANNTTHVLSGGSNRPQPPNLSLNGQHPASFGPTASSFQPGNGGVINVGMGHGQQRSKGGYGEEWSDGKSSLVEGKEGHGAGLIPEGGFGSPQQVYGPGGVKVTIDREVDYAGRR